MCRDLLQPRGRHAHVYTAEAETRRSALVARHRARKHRADVPVDSCLMSKPASLPLVNGCSSCADYPGRHRAVTL